MNHPYSSMPRYEYRFPGFRWNGQQQCWLPEISTLPSSILKPREIVHEHVDPASILPPAYQPGQWITFQDIRGSRHRGHIESIMIYSTTTEDSDQRESLYQWTYLSQYAITYWTRAPSGTLYSLKAADILGLAAPALALFDSHASKAQLVTISSSFSDDYSQRKKGMSNPIRTIHIGTNEDMARVYFPHLVRSLPQYRDDLLRYAPTWTRVSKYVSTLYVALECASSPQDLEILQQELQRFSAFLPLHMRYQLTTVHQFDWAIYHLQQQGDVLLGTPLHPDTVYRLLSILTCTLSVISNQTQIDTVRRTLEPISGKLGQFSLAEES